MRTTTLLVRAALVALALLPASGCAVAVRALAVAEAVDTVRDLAAGPGGTAEPAAVGAGGGGAVLAVVRGTGGSGLRLNAEPGAGRLRVEPEGAAVVPLCQVQGPPAGRRGHESATWTRVRTADGAVGFMANAYLEFTAPSGVPEC